MFVRILPDFDVQNLLDDAISYLLFMKGGHGMWSAEDLEMVKQALYVASETVTTGE